MSRTRQIIALDCGPSGNVRSPPQSPFKTRGVHSYINDVGVGELFFAAVMIGLGVRGLFYGDFAAPWQNVPSAIHLPTRQQLAYASAAIELMYGTGLLWRRTRQAASTAGAAFVLVWLVLLKLPPLLAAPQVEVNWLGFGEIAVILSASWVLYAVNAGSWSQAHMTWATKDRGIGWARLLFVLALPTIGLAHFVYADASSGFVPAYLPWKHGWVYLTGAASLFASLGILLGVLPRLAAAAEAAMLGLITLMVWLPMLLAAPGNSTWTPLLMSTSIAAGAWVIANTYRATTWVERGSVKRHSKRTSDCNQ